MSVRLATALALLALMYGLLHGSVTVPVLSLIGLVAWALFATALAIVLAWRQRTCPPGRAAQQRPLWRKAQPMADNPQFRNRGVN